MSDRSCSAACTIFFKGDLLLSEEAPNRALADTDIARGKLTPAPFAPYCYHRGNYSNLSEQIALIDGYG
jgi:hypothetical protein